MGSKGLSPEKGRSQAAVFPIEVHGAHEEDPYHHPVHHLQRRQVHRCLQQGALPTGAGGRRGPFSLSLIPHQQGVFPGVSSAPSSPSPPWPRGVVSHAPTHADPGAPHWCPPLLDSLNTASVSLLTCSEAFSGVSPLVNKGLPHVPHPADTFPSSPSPWKVEGLGSW